MLMRHKLTYVCRLCSDMDENNAGLCKFHSPRGVGSTFKLMGGINFWGTWAWCKGHLTIGVRATFFFFGGGGGGQRAYCPILRGPNLTTRHHGWRRVRKFRTFRTSRLPETAISEP